MTLRIGASEGQPAVTARHIFPAILTAGVASWVAFVGFRGALLALQSSGLSIGGEAQRTFASSQLLWAAILIYLFCLEAAVTARRFRPALTIPVTAAAGGLVVLVGAIGTSSVVSVVVVSIMMLLCFSVGNTILHRLPASPANPTVRIPMAVGIGLTPLGLGLYLLATLDALNAFTVIGGALVVLLLLIVLDRDLIARDLARARRWRPAPPTWLETIVLGLTIGFVAMALLEAFAPETSTDAMWQHLPIARDVWRSGSVNDFPLMGVSLSPIQGHLFYAVAYGFGGMTAAKLVHTAVGLVSILGVAGMGWLIAGRVAGVVGAAIFATMPVVVWELGHAFTDFFPVFSTVATVLCVLMWQRDGMLIWLAIAGALAGFGFAAKLNMGLVAVALAIAILVVGKGPGQWRARAFAVTAFGLGGALVVVPWLLRGLAISGTVPGLNPFLARLGGRIPGIPAPTAVSLQAEKHAPVDAYTSRLTVGELQEIGIGHTPLDLLQVPWTMTFQGKDFGFPVYGHGEVGIMLLLLLPLALFAPRTRSTALLAVAAVVSLAAWWLSPYQILRHLLPTLAIACALIGAGVASIVSAAETRPKRVLAAIVQGAIIIGIIAAPFLYLPNQRTDPPIGLILGQETVADYLPPKVPAASALLASNGEDAADGSIAYIGRWSESGQIYSDTRLTYFGVEFHVDPVLPDYNGLDQLGTSPDEVLTSLNHLGVTHIIWDRPQTNALDWRSTLLSTEFLSQHSRILEGDRGGYLLEILPEAEERWGLEGPNLFNDPTFETIGGYGPWLTTGRVSKKRGAVTMRAGSSLGQKVPVSGGSPYLMMVSASCTRPDGRAELTFRWYDDRGALLRIDTEPVVPGTEGSEQFHWRRAPERAVVLSAELASRQCTFTEAALHGPT